MPEDEYDFEGLNPAKLFAIDKKVQPFDYEKQLRQKGHTHGSPPDIGGLFKALATEYVPTRIVHLPPKIVAQPGLGSRLSDFLAIAFGLACYLIAIVLIGICYPYVTLTTFEAKMNMQAATNCTITDTQVGPAYTDENGEYYEPHVHFTFNTAGGQQYTTSEYWVPTYSSSSDAQTYISWYQVHHSYLCWYNPTDPTEATFFRQDAGFWDYAGLVFNGCIFLVLGVLVNACIIISLCSSFFAGRRGRA